MSRPRDNQRAKAYAAEGTAFGEALFQGTMTHQAVVDLVRDLTEEVDGPVVHVRRRRSGRRSYGGRLNDKARTPYIGLIPSHRNPMIVCHELAHAFVDHEAPGVHAWHGSQWCRVYLMLLELACGRDAAVDLRRAFDRHGVDHWTDIEESAA